MVSFNALNYDASKFDFKFTTSSGDKIELSMYDSVKPLVEKFLKAKKEHQKEITNFVHNLKSLLPKPKNENHKLAIKHHTVNTFDEILKNIKASIKELKKTKELFDKIFNNKFEIIA